MLVKDVMTSGVLVARPADEVRTVVTKMLSRHCGAVPVVDDEHRLLGIVAVRDVLLPLYPNFGDYVHDSVQSRNFLDMEDGYAQVLGQKVEDIMTRNPRGVSPDDPILKAASLMGVHNFRRMPVVEDGRLLGMVSIGDINRGLFFKPPSD
jgi:CBS domain-containing protein